MEIKVVNVVNFLNYRVNFKYFFLYFHIANKKLLYYMYVRLILAIIIIIFFIQNLRKAPLNVRCFLVVGFQ